MDKLLDIMGTCQGILDYKKERNRREVVKLVCKIITIQSLLRTELTRLSRLNYTHSFG